MVMARPLDARAQPAGLPRIAYVCGRSLGTDAQWLEAFRAGLARTGYVDGQNVMIDARWANGKFAEVPALIGELMALKPRIIAAVGGDPVGVAAKAATSTIPVVFAAGSDPVRLGLVGDMEKPSRNLTGVTLWASELDVKRLDLLHEIVPAARKVALLTNPTSSAAVHERQAMLAAAASLGLELKVLDAASSSDIEHAFQSLAPGKVDALAVVDDAFLISRRDRIVGLAALRKLPAVYPSRAFTETGGLLSYGPRWSDMYRTIGSYAGRILDGEKPADLPVQRPIAYELFLNRRTAAALRLSPPAALLDRADKLIE